MIIILGILALIVIGWVMDALYTPRTLTESPEEARKRKEAEEAEEKRKMIKGIFDRIEGRESVGVK